MERRERFARTILNGFESYFADFQNITLAAKSRFENADWHGMQEASRERIDIYKEKVKNVYQYVELIAGDQLHDFDFWHHSKAIYADLIEGHNNFEIAETFFNSIYCSVFQHRKGVGPATVNAIRNSATRFSSGLQAAAQPIVAISMASRMAYL